MASASAVARDFGTYELIDVVLAAIDPPRSIFILQRVCKDWRYVIGRSDTIQQALFGPSTQRPVRPSTLTAAGDHDSVVYDEALTFNNIWQEPDVPFDDQALTGTDKVSVSYAFWLDWGDMRLEGQYLPQAVP